MEIELLNKIKIEKKNFYKMVLKSLEYLVLMLKNTQTKDSDIDLLYDIEPIFIQNILVLKLFSKLNEIKESLQKVLNKKS